MILLPLLAIVGVVTSVHDGDTFRIGRTSIRLQGIDANELDGSCHNNCAAMSGAEARDYLANLALGQEVTCDETGTSYKRVTAWCSVGGVDLSCEMVQAGAAIRWDRYDRGGRLIACEQGSGRRRRK
jgi:endonuclease YncB( thermonuclease family)